MSKVNYIDLISGKVESISKIVIPKIQRDYAQGRESKKSIRENFLDELFQAIELDHELELDFVYGDVEGGVLKPLDGQQRLTTLFLLDLALGRRAGAEDAGHLANFTYETRDTSRNFIADLINHIPAREFRPGIRRYIDDQPWFNSLAAADPTVEGMVTMLEAIVSRIDNLFCCGCNNADCPISFSRAYSSFRRNITFQFITLADLDSSDELYIKMNSRGRLLNDFERFKVRLTKIVSRNSKQDYTDFFRKTDVEWTNMLWAYRDRSRDRSADFYKASVEDKMLNLFRNYLLIEGLKHGHYVDFREKGYSKGDDYLATLKVPEIAEHLLTEDEADRILRRFEHIMDNMAGLEGGTAGFFSQILTSEKGLDPENYRIRVKKTDLLAVALEHKLQISELIQTEAMFSHFAGGCGDPALFQDRFRVIRNLLENSGESDLRWNSIKILLAGTDRLMESGQLPTVGFNEEQMRQEVFKDKWLTANPAKATQLKAVENLEIIHADLASFIDNGIIHYDELTLLPRLFGDCSAERLLAIHNALLAQGDYGNDLGRKFSAYGCEDSKSWHDRVFRNTNKTTGQYLVRLIRRLGNCFCLSNIKAAANLYLTECESRQSYPWRYYYIKYADSMILSLNNKIKLGGRDRSIFKESEYMRFSYNTANKKSYCCRSFAPPLQSLVPEFIPAVDKAWDGIYKERKVFIREHSFEISYEAVDETIKFPISSNSAGYDTTDCVELIADKLVSL